MLNIIDPQRTARAGFFVLLAVVVVLFIYRVSTMTPSDIEDQKAVLDARLKKEELVRSGAPANTLVGTCIGKAETWTVGRYPMIPGAIFISIASYRDDECKDTVFDLFAKATNPDAIFVGVVQQNSSDQKEDCFDKCEACSKRKKSGHIRVTNFSHMQAKGPTFARYHCSKLWRGEQWYLQIDSHIQFEKGWDDTLIEQIKLTGDLKPVITGYPPTKEQMALSRKNNYNETVVSCSNGLNEDGMPNIGSAVVPAKPRHTPIPCMEAAAGFMCFPGAALRDVPYDPFLSYTFFGEEILHSARMWTAGYNIYAIGKPICTHHYYRHNKPKYTGDHPEADGCRKIAMQRVRYLLGLSKPEDVHPDYFIDVDKYGLGTVRTIQEFWKKSGFNMENKTTTKICEVTID